MSWASAEEGQLFQERDWNDQRQSGDTSHVWVMAKIPNLDTLDGTHEDAPGDKVKK